MTCITLGVRSVVIRRRIKQKQEATSIEKRMIISINAKIVVLDTICSTSLIW
jgi:hypothetical protein